MTETYGNHEEPLSPKLAALDDYVSPARLSLWLKCPLAFRLRHLQGILPPTSPARFVRERVDAGLELYYRLRQREARLNVQDIAQRLEHSWDQAVADEGMKFDSPAEQTLYRKQFLEMVTAYGAGFPHNEPTPLAVMTLMEAPLVHPVTGDELGIPLAATVDLILDTHPRSTLVDFNVAGPDEEFMEIIHEIELSCCAYAYRQVTGTCEQELQIRRLVRTQPLTVEIHRFPPRTEIHFRRLFAVIVYYLDDLRSRRFVFRPGPDCMGCDYCHTHCHSRSV